MAPICFRALLAAVLPMCFTASALADVTLSTRTINPNGRPVQEIRLGEEPGGINLRGVFVTNGPTAGTTSLVTAVAAPNLWYDPGVAQPVFTSIIPSGTVFGLGGGCRRGNQLDFPFINNNRPQILRILNGIPTVIPLTVAAGEFFDSGECTVSPDLLQTWYIYSNRSTNRLFLFVDQGGPNDLANPLVTFAMKTPFGGGLRPQIGNIRNQNRSMALMWMEASGQTRWRQYNLATFNVDFNCLVGTQTPAPTTFTIPRGARVLGPSVVGDFNGDGVAETAEINTSNCTTAPATVSVGPVAGVGFNWTEPAAVVTPDGGRAYAIGGTLVTFDAGGGISITAGPHAGNAGPFDACGFKSTELQDGIVSLSVDGGNLVRVVQWVRTPIFPIPGDDPIWRSSMEDRGSVTGWRCVEYELRR